MLSLLVVHVAATAALTAVLLAVVLAQAVVRAARAVCARVGAVLAEAEAEAGPAAAAWEVPHRLHAVPPLQAVMTEVDDLPRSWELQPR